MKKISKLLIFSIAFILIVLSVFLLNKTKKISIKRTLAAVGEDDRFYVRDSKWSELFNGVINIDKLSGTLFENKPFYLAGTCTGFLLEGDVIVTAAHCLGSGFGADYLNEDASINYKNLKRMRVFFGDARFYDEQAFNERSKPYTAKDVFVAANHKTCDKGVSFKDFFKDDFAFIKLNEPIPKKYKRFKLLKDINLNEYKILDKKFQKGLSVSTVGYPGDGRGRQRLAHIGCRIRDERQYKGTWNFYTDCDTTGGASGSPFFKILRHKKTGEIELGVLGFLTSAVNLINRDREPEYDDNDEEIGYHLGIGSQYHQISYDLKEDIGHNSRALSLNNHLFFNEILEGFKKDSSQWRSRKIPPVKMYDLLKESFLEKKLKSLNEKELKFFLNDLREKKLLKLIGCHGRSVFGYLQDVDKSDLLKNEKKEILKKFVKDIDIEIKRKRKKLLNKTKKTLSYKNINKAYGLSLLEKNGDFKDLFKMRLPLENLEEDKKLSDKMWREYFGE